jgi:hypothetical protein
VRTAKRFSQRAGGTKSWERRVVLEVVIGKRQDDELVGGKEETKGERPAFFIGLLKRILWRGDLVC